ncbi:FAD-dependent oxidoreductase [Kibdelosporangium phytohabitans]|uniref:FAD dependent oxidoreductase domain-containing protein n=1 Tax=Kibdelosporangium phytohabitans TaxID=860235 RepID=A0A0N9IBG2_9PSEU|nr:FAD-dependent oxidoreductase [Kibdelosporangium phytohabitans]ALG12176.1 hypothetical protein AOZ06_39720 [Kibdelosporangium phytohabitans]MBE1463703.1 glycine/D-amino acid oxidase-like deaminating enzyme [Kibdelosporangium phytohabitans]
MASEESMNQDIVVVGGGIIGSAIAYYLARPGPADRVRVLEPDQDYAFSSTPRSASAIRGQFNLGVDVAMSRHGYAFFKRATENPGVGDEEVDIAFEDCPYLTLCAPDGVARLRGAYERQLRNGADGWCWMTDSTWPPRSRATRPARRRHTCPSWRTSHCPSRRASGNPCSVRRPDARRAIPMIAPHRQCPSPAGR